MTLATRCAACGTVFRVVQDQLRVSEGWVRCGRCNQVFNAVDHLVDLSRVAAPAPAPAPTPAAPTMAAAAVDAAHTPLPAGLVESDGAVSPYADIPAQPGVERGSEAQPAPPEAYDAPGDPGLPQDDVGPMEAPVEPAVSVHVQLPEITPDGPGPRPEAEPSGLDPEEPGGAPTTPALRADPAWAESGSTDEAPSFLQAADREARWQRPALRRGLFALAALLMATLVLQLAVEYRDFVAARWTATRPLLEQLCRWSNCRIEAPRWIEALAVDSSGLVRVEGTSTYRLSVVLHNRSAMAIALPSIDLTLTDSQGRVIARRAFLAGELGSAVTTVAPAAELPLTATLAIAERPVSGYTIEIFYP